MNPTQANVVEWTLLRYCARNPSAPFDDGLLHELVERDPDWDEVLRLAWRHGVSLRLHHRLARLSGIAIPSHVQTELDRRAAVSTRRGLHGLAELLSLLEEYTAAGIEALPLKGPVLAETMYAQPALREYVDLDVLVRPEDVGSAERVLTGRRYQRVEKLEGGQAIAHGNAEYALHYGRDDGMSVDLHWRLARGYFATGIDAEQPWQSAREIVVQGHRIRALSAEMTVLALCVHGCKHRPMPWAKLKWVCDMDEILHAAAGPDWQRTAALARRMGCTRMVRVGLVLVEQLLGTIPPRSLREDVHRDTDAIELGQTIAECLARDGGGPKDILSSMRLDLKLRERRREHLGYVLRRIVTPAKRDWSALVLPAGLAFLYIPFRLVRLSGRYASDMLHRLNGFKRGAGDRTAIASDVETASVTPPRDAPPASGRESHGDG